MRVLTPRPGFWRPALVLSLVLTALPAAGAGLRTASAACPEAPRMPTYQTLVAHPTRSGLPIFDQPEEGSFRRTLRNPTHEGQNLHLRVVNTRTDWYRVQYAARPNGVTAWVRKSDVRTTVTPYRLLVQRCSNLIWLFNRGEPVMRFPAAVGKSSTPTPRGDFFVDFVEAWRPDSKYGPWLFSVSGFSEVYTSFGNGGTGQIGIHGTQARGSVGGPTSNGCVRMFSEEISQLQPFVEPGTPVLIVD
ncbi:MAG TPA: L,D-transpeptidase family protein [Mycobacteriales bacterium]|nr:L,D-transpeptidase family protein [Mycobacteriales bacterium]